MLNMRCDPPIATCIVATHFNYLLLLRVPMVHSPALKCRPVLHEPLAIYSESLTLTLSKRKRSHATFAVRGSSQSLCRRPRAKLIFLVVILLEKLAEKLSSKLLSVVSVAGVVCCVRFSTFQSPRREWAPANASRPIGSG